MTQSRVSIVNYPDRRHLVLRYRDPLSGRTSTRSAKTANRREAERAAAEWETQLSQGRQAIPANVSWSAFRERYESEVVPGVAPKTAAMVNTTFNWIESILRPTQLSQLSASRISYLQSQLRQNGCAETTIRSYLAHLMAALRWAVDVDLLVAAPRIQRPRRAKSGKVMKGRPITQAEFNTMLATTTQVVGVRAVASWVQLLEVLWFSGLRLGEALNLHWDRIDRLHPLFGDGRPMLRIPAEYEKGNTDRLIPLTPDFVEYLLQTPEADRRGPIVNPIASRTGQRVDVDWASRTIARIGTAAEVVVDVHPRTGKLKYASAHDLRRSFGERWARLVMPQVLKEIMRHESIDTTLRYYVGANATLSAEQLWMAYTRTSEETPTETK